MTASCDSSKNELPRNKNNQLCNFLQVKILNRNCNALIDTGAGRSIISKQWCDKLHLDLENLQNDDLSILINADKGHIKVWGTVQVPICINGISVMHRFLVIDNLISKILLGCDFLIKCEAKIDLKHRIISFFEDSVFANLIARSENFQSTFQLS